MGCGGSKAADAGSVSIKTFTIERMVGQGGFGKVNAVTSKVDGKLYAMKTLNKSTVLKKKQVKMLMNERNLLVMLTDCRYLANMHYALLDSTACYLVLDLALGGDLRYHLVTQGKVPEPACRFYVAQIMEALAFLHSKNVLHRDIKPENLLLDSNGYLKVTDLGISKKMKADGTYTGKSGTKPYMPPETLEGKPQGTPSDIYMLGITMCELLLGERPWKRASSKEAKDPAAHFASMCPEMSEAGRDFMCRCLARKPKERHTIEQLKAHAWFEGFSFEALDAQTMKVPFTPDITKANFEADDDDGDRMFGSGDKVEQVSAGDQRIFESFPFNTQMTADP